MAADYVFALYMRCNKWILEVPSSANNKWINGYECSKESCMISWSIALSLVSLKNKTKKICRYITLNTDA